jgi:hypothetical protein
LTYLKASIRITSFPDLTYHLKKKNKEYAKQCREDSKVSDATLNRRFTI